MPYQDKQETRISASGPKKPPEGKQVSARSYFGLPNSLVLRSMEDTADPGSRSLPVSGNFGHELSHAIRHDPAPVRHFLSQSSGVIQRNPDDDDDFVIVKKDGDDPEHPAGAAAAAAAPQRTRASAFPRRGAGAARAAADLSVPDEDDDDWGRVAAGPEEGGAAGLENRILTTLFSSRFGLDVFNGIKEDLERWIKNGTGRDDITFSSEDRSIRFMIRAAYEDYLTRDILKEIADKHVTNKTEADERVSEYRALIKQVSKRAVKYDLEVIASDTGLLPESDEIRLAAQAPERRPYELSPDAADGSGTVTSISRGDRALQRVFDDIDHAQTPEEAFRAFAAYTGNMNAKLDDKAIEFRRAGAINMDRLRSKLKHMARMVRDFRELRHTIRNMYEVSDVDTSMETNQDVDSGYQNDLGFNPLLERNLPGAGNDLPDDPGFSAAPQEYDGNHELGHVLPGTLIDETKSPDEYGHDLGLSVWEDQILRNVIKNHRGMMIFNYNMMRMPGTHRTNKLEGGGWEKGQILTSDPLFTRDPAERDATPEQVEKLNALDLAWRKDPRNSARRDAPSASVPAPLPVPAPAPAPLPSLAALDLAESRTNPPVPAPAQAPGLAALDLAKSRADHPVPTPDLTALDLAGPRANPPVPAPAPAPDLAALDLAEARTDLPVTVRAPAAAPAPVPSLAALDLAESRANLPVSAPPPAPAPPDVPRERTRMPTSEYGTQDASEFIAEAFADVYAHGNQSRPMSIAIMKEYQKLQIVKQQIQFAKDKSKFDADRRKAEEDRRKAEEQTLGGRFRHFFSRKKKST